MRVYAKGIGRYIFTLVAILSLAIPSWGKDGVATIVGFNDMHGKIFSYEATVKVKDEKVKEDVGGIARMATVIREIKESSPGNVIVAQMGDTVEGPLFFFFHGKAELAGIDAIPVDVGIPGNHEFDLGADVFEEFVKNAGFHMICANMETSRDDLKLPSTWAISLKNGLKVGFFGLLCPELKSLTSPGPDISVDQDFISISRRCVDELKNEGCDVIVALTHIGIDGDRMLAKSVSGIHAIIGGHSHTVMESPEIVEGPKGWKTIIGQAGSMARYVGSMTVSVKDGKLDTEGSGWKLVEMRQSVAKAEDVEAAIEPYGDELRKNLGKKVGNFASDMDATKAVVRAKESALGDYLADGLRWKADSDVALVNGGGIRGDRIFPAGEISYNTIMEIFPWGNTMQIFSFSGAELKEILEISASALKGVSDDYDPAMRATSGAFLQLSGLKAVFDLSREPALIDNDSKLIRGGSRVVSMEILRDGAWIPVDENAEYTVATYSWTGGGGDKYYPFAAKKPRESYVTDSDVFAETIRHTGGIVDKVEDGRIVIKN